MGIGLTLIVIFVADFLITWGLLHAALEIAQIAGVPWEPTAIATLFGAVAVKLVRFIF